MIRMAWALWLASVALGCGGADQRYRSAIASGKVNIEPIKEFARLFPASLHIITHYSGDAGDPQWNAAVGLYGRYVLVMELPISLNKKKDAVVSAGAARFVLFEVQSISIDPQNRTETVTPGELDKRFGADGWQAIVSKNGDVSSALDVPVKTNRPVPGFEAYWRRGYQ